MKSILIVMAIGLFALPSLAEVSSKSLKNYECTIIDGAGGTKDFWRNVSAYTEERALEIAMSSYSYVKEKDLYQTNMSCVGVAPKSKELAHCFIQEMRCQEM